MNQWNRTADELAVQEAIDSAVALGIQPVVDACTFVQMSQALLIDAYEDEDYPQIHPSEIALIDWRRFTMSVNEYAAALALDSVLYSQDPIH